MVFRDEIIPKGLPHRREFAFATIHSRTEVLDILIKFRAECDKLLNTNIFYTNLNKAVRLDEFEQLQVQSLQNFKTHLRDK